MIQIVDTYHEIQCFLKNRDFDMVQYQNYVSNISPALRDVVMEDTQSYDFEKEILPVMRYLFDHPEMADEAHDSFRQVTKLLFAKEDWLQDKIETTVIFYMGLCSGAGWATQLAGKPVILLGIEKIVELNWIDENSMIGLLYHELGHAWHFQNRITEKSFHTSKQRDLWQLYAEGMAMYFEHRLMNDSEFYHQNKNGWLNWCRQNRQRIAREYLRRIENNESCQSFFGDWCDFEGYSDVGYFLGCEVIHQLSEDYSDEALIDLGLDTFETYLKQYAFQK